MLLPLHGRQAQSNYSKTHLTAWCPWLKNIQGSRQWIKFTSLPWSSATTVNLHVQPLNTHFLRHLWALSACRFPSTWCSLTPLSLGARCSVYLDRVPHILPEGAILGKILFVCCSGPKYSAIFSGSSHFPVLPLGCLLSDKNTESIHHQEWDLQEIF